MIDWSKADCDSQKMAIRVAWRALLLKAEVIIGHSEPPSCEQTGNMRKYHSRSGQTKSLIQKWTLVNKFLKTSPLNPFWHKHTRNYHQLEFSVRHSFRKVGGKIQATEQIQQLLKGCHGILPHYHREEEALQQLLELEKQPCHWSDDSLYSTYLFNYLAD